MILLLQQDPIVVEVTKQPTPTRDVSVDFVLGMFSMTGLLILALILCSALVGGLFILYRHRRGAAAPPVEPSHTRLGI